MFHCKTLIAVILLFSSLASGAPFTEIGDAGRLPGTAQGTLGAGPLTTITGTLIELNGIDMYWISIVNPFLFSATTTGLLGFIPDPQLFLFNSSGLGVYSNDDAFGAQSQLPAASIFGPQVSGLYLLAIGRFNNEPLSSGGRIFFDGTSGVNAPDLSAGGNGVLTGWTDDLVQRIDFDDSYEINLTGSTFANIPEPATFVLSAAGLLLIGTLRRRWAS